MKDDINAARRNLDQIMSEVRQLEASRGYNQALGEHSCSYQNKSHAEQVFFEILVGLVEIEYNVQGRFSGTVNLVIPLETSVKSTCNIFKPTGTRWSVSPLI